MIGNTVAERPVAPFILSLIAGVLILVGSGMMASLLWAGPYYFGGMMGGYGGMGGYYGMMRGFGFGGYQYAAIVIGVISGIAILVGALMMYSRPEKATFWGALVLAFSVVSLSGLGGFFLGAALGVVGGILAITGNLGRS